MIDHHTGCIGLNMPTNFVCARRGTVLGVGVKSIIPLHEIRKPLTVVDAFGCIVFCKSSKQVKCSLDCLIETPNPKSSEYRIDRLQHN